MHYKFVMFMSWLICHTPYGLLMAAGRVLGNLYYLLTPLDYTALVS